MKDGTPEGGYYICDMCAHLKGYKWPEGHCGTLHEDVCPYCKTKGVLAPVIDYIRPGVKDVPGLMD